MNLQARASEMELGDRVSYLNDRDERDTIEVRKLIRDCGCLHVWPQDAGRVVTFRNDCKIEIVRS